MSYLVVGKRSGGHWELEIQGIGQTTAADQAGIETAARALLASSGHADAADADLQLLMPDFEVDLSETLMPRGDKIHWEILSAVLALLVVIGAIALIIIAIRS